VDEDPDSMSLELDAEALEMLEDLALDEEIEDEVGNEDL